MKLLLTFLAVLIATVNTIPVHDSEKIGEICKLIVHHLDKDVPHHMLPRIKDLLLGVIKKPEGYDEVAVSYSLNQHQQVTERLQYLVENIKDYLPIYVLDRIQYILEMMNRADNIPPHFLKPAKKLQTYPLYHPETVHQITEPRIPSDFLRPSVPKGQTYPLYSEIMHSEPRIPSDFLSPSVPKGQTYSLYSEIMHPEPRIPSDFLRPSVPKGQTYSLYPELMYPEPRIPSDFLRPSVPKGLTYPLYPEIMHPEQRIPSSFLRPSIPKGQTYPLHAEVPDEFLRPIQPKFGLRPVKNNRIPSDLLRPEIEFLPNKKPHHPKFPHSIRPLPEFIPNDLLSPEFMKPVPLPEFIPTVLLPLDAPKKE